MNEKYIYTALLKINNNTSLLELTHEGLSFQKISDLIKDLIKNKFIEESENEIKLSAKGIENLMILEKVYKKRNKKDWIKPVDEKFRIEKIKNNFIFVPDQSELHF